MTETTKRTLADSIESETVPAEAEARTLSGKIEKTRIRRKSYVMDLRIHSPSSLGYLAIEGIDTAPALVRLAKVKGLDMIAVTDYHSGEFIDRILEAAKDSNISVIPGAVVRCTVEGCQDVVLSCLFPENFGTTEMEQFLDSIGIPQSRFGSREYVVGLPFDELLEKIEALDGVAIPTRMDKTPYRKQAIAVLVEKYGFRAFDLAYYPESIEFFKEHWPKIKFQLFSFSNANALAQVGSRNSKVKLAQPGFEGLREIVLREEAC